MVALLAAHPNQVSVNDVRNKINEILTDGISNVITSPDAPTDPADDGDLWFDETNAILYVYTDSVNGWVQTNGGGGGGGGGTPAGADNEVQFNDNGSFGASNKFTYDGGTVTVPRLHVLPDPNSTSGNEGGEIALQKATNSTLNGGIILDMYIDSLRIFEGASPFKGAYLDLNECGNYLAGTQTNLLSGGGGGSEQKTLLNTPTVLHAQYDANNMQFEYITSQITTTSGTIQAGVTPGIPASATTVQLHAITNTNTGGLAAGFLVKHPSQTQWKRLISETMSDGAYYPTTEISWYPLDSDGKLEWKLETTATASNLNYLLLEIQGYGERNGPRAYVTFDGTSSNLTSSIFNSFNVSSITDNNVGDYTINYQNQVPTPVVTAMVGEDITNKTDLANQNINLYDATNSSIRVRINQDSAGYSVGARDKGYVSVVVH